MKNIHQRGNVGAAMVDPAARALANWLTTVWMVVITQDRGRLDGYNRDQFLPYLHEYARPRSYPSLKTIFFPSGVS
jgi:hypothetical protein